MHFFGKIRTKPLFWRPGHLRESKKNAGEFGNKANGEPAVKLFDNHYTMLQKSLDFRTKRNELLGANVANLETPGYKAKDLVFEEALGNAMRAHEPGPLRVTNSRHMDGRPLIPLDRVKPQVIRTASPDASLDGNTVNLETEMAKLAENQIAYQALTRMISDRFQALKIAIGEGGQ